MSITSNTRRRGWRVLRHGGVGGIGAVALLGAATFGPTSVMAQNACDAVTKAVLETMLEEIVGERVGPVLAASDAVLDYLTTADDKKLDTALTTLANGSLAIACPGCGVAMTAGGLTVGGVTYTIDEAKALQLDAFLCGTTTWGLLQMEGFFKTGGAQTIAPGVTCENFADRITNLRDFAKLRDYFRGGYSRSVHEMGGSQNRDANQALLDGAWAKVEFRLGARLYDRLRAELVRQAIELKEKQGCADGAGTAGGDTPVPGAFGPPQRRFGKLAPDYEDHEKKFSGVMGPDRVSITIERKPVEDGAITIRHVYAGNRLDILRPGDIVDLTCSSTATVTGKWPPNIATSCFWNVSGSVVILLPDSTQVGAIAGVMADGTVVAKNETRTKFEVLPGGGITIRAEWGGFHWGQSDNWNPAEYVYTYTPE